MRFDEIEKHHEAYTIFADRLEQQEGSRSDVDVEPTTEEFDEVRSMYADFHDTEVSGRFGPLGGYENDWSRLFVINDHTAVEISAHDDGDMFEVFRVSLAEDSPAKTFVVEEIDCTLDRLAKITNLGNPSREYITDSLDTMRRVHSLAFPEKYTPEQLEQLSR